MNPVCFTTSVWTPQRGHRSGDTAAGHRSGDTAAGHAAFASQPVGSNWGGGTETQIDNLVGLKQLVLASVLNKTENTMAGS